MKKRKEKRKKEEEEITPSVNLRRSIASIGKKKA
jgi:hypothetical protein